MSKNILVALLVVGLIVMGAALLAILVGRPQPGPSTTTTTMLPFAKPVVKANLPKVLTIYQKGEYYSEKASLISKTLASASKYKDIAIFQAVNLLEEPQLAGYYGVTQIPALIIVSSSGRVLLKHEGFLSKEEIILLLSSLKG